MTTPYQTLQTQLQATPKTWLITGVAGFIGMPQMNFYDAELVLEDGQYAVVLDGAKVTLPEEKQAKLKANGMEVLPPPAALKSDMAKVGDTMLKEWLDKAGPEGKTVVDAYRK